MTADATGAEAMEGPPARSMTLNISGETGLKPQSSPESTRGSSRTGKYRHKEIHFEMILNVVTYGRNGHVASRINCGL